MSAAIKQHASRTLQVSQDAVTSRGWLYPLYGISYLFTHKRLLTPLLSLLLPSILVSLAILFASFFLFYLPQAALLSIVQLGPVGLLSAFTLTLAESGFLINQVLKNFVLADTLDETFDRVLISKGLDSLVAKGRETPAGGKKSGNKGGKLGKSLMKPLNKFKPDEIVKYLLTIPLNAIPIVGTVFFYYLNGTSLGPSLLSRYFQLSSLSPAQKSSFISTHRGALSSFGIVALLISVVPVVGAVVGGYTNVVGAALMAVDLEKREGEVVKGERAIRGGAKKEL